MKKLYLILLLSALIQITACKAEKYPNYESFYAEADVVISDVIFEAEITEDSIIFTSENLSNQILYKNNKILFDDLSLDVTCENNSAFYIYDLIANSLFQKKELGSFRNIEYSCEFNDDKTPKKIIWGDITINFNYFK